MFPTIADIRWYKRETQQNQFTGLSWLQSLQDLLHWVDVPITVQYPQHRLLQRPHQYSSKEQVRLLPFRILHLLLQQSPSLKEQRYHGWTRILRTTWSSTMHMVQSPRERFSPVILYWKEKVTCLNLKPPGPTRTTVPFIHRWKERSLWPEYSYIFCQSANQGKNSLSYFFKTLSRNPAIFFDKEGRQ